MRPGDVTENRHRGSLNKGQLTLLSQGMMKKRDDKDDEVRTTAKPQVRVVVK
jgi:hypothetical protein